MTRCDGFLYTVREGDTIVSIARMHHIKLAELIVANSHIDDPTKLSPGQEVCIPQGKGINQVVEPDFGVQLPTGYRIKKYVKDLTFPTGITFSDAGEMYVVESGYRAGSVLGSARVLRVYPDGSTAEVTRGFLPPVTGITWYDESLYVSESGYPGQITRVFPDGSREAVINNLPTGGDYQLSQVVFGPDGRMYFGIGTVTNSGVVGPDNTWLGKRPRFRDFPSRNFELAERSFVSENVLKPEIGNSTVTGAFQPFGTAAKPGQTVKSQFPYTGVIYQANPDGSGMKVFADGVRNPFGLGFAPGGSLFATDNGMDIRGSRPVANAWDTFEEINFGEWYGWPDYNARVPVTDPRFKPDGGPQPQFLITNQPPLAEGPVALFEPHSVPAKFDFLTGTEFGFQGEAFVALFGHIDHMAEPLPEPAGFKIIRVNIETGEVNDFMVILDPRNPGNGPVHPIQARFCPGTGKLYVVDFGQTGDTGGPPKRKSGAIWEISR
ncbi:LysM peptidoglycan-binding domain-containing protein [Phosphitispora fastidiosa]|uniref:LysM peptidoglycan-binding domain-containing protein n=1 Tax=Phosphitispora fastidiosa TaxID=2837202 RepID=UPI001E3CD9BD|nr:LysM peptidoglycan-binding domain-containing protein [Phosphitispora fastidiosa]MBU7006808.1 glucose/arabinose dehydrogenase [Phosphitispora fastidiosa]